MGKTSKRLTILLHPPLDTWEEFAALKAQGHEVRVHETPFSELYDYDLILGPTCHRMNEDLRKYLPLALAEGRRVKYPKGEKA